MVISRPVHFVNYITWHFCCQTCLRCFCLGRFGQTRVFWGWEFFPKFQLLQKTCGFGVGGGVVFCGEQEFGRTMNLAILLVTVLGWKGDPLKVLTALQRWGIQRSRLESPGMGELVVQRSHGFFGRAAVEPIHACLF